jgi:hypothetical protein
MLFFINLFGSGFRFEKIGCLLLHEADDESLLFVFHMQVRHCRQLDADVVHVECQKTGCAEFLKVMVNFTPQNPKNTVFFLINTLVRLFLDIIF